MQFHGLWPETHLKQLQVDRIRSVEEGAKTAMLLDKSKDEQSNTFSICL